MIKFCNLIFGKNARKFFNVNTRLKSTKRKIDFSSKIVICIVLSYLKSEISKIFKLDFRKKMQKIFKRQNSFKIDQKRAIRSVPESAHRRRDGDHQMTL